MSVFTFLRCEGQELNRQPNAIPNVRDEVEQRKEQQRRKMSKSFGNVVSPEEVITAHGVDVLRMYVLSSNAPWDDLKFNWEGVRSVNRAINIFRRMYTDFHSPT
jgi:leucyl-tRNA synthetase